MLPDRYRRHLVPAAVCIILGLSVALMARTQTKATEASRKMRIPETAVAQFVQVTEETAKLREELARLRQTAAQQATLSQLQEELLIEASSSGMVAVQGPGIVLILRDLGSLTASRTVLSRDVVRILNELRAAGAEAISVNGLRVTDRMAFRNSGLDKGPVWVDGAQVDGPLVIQAIGDPAVLSASMKMRGGPVAELAIYIHIVISEAPALAIPAAQSPPAYRQAKPKP